MATEKTLNLWQKLVEVRKAVPTLTKDGKCSFGDKFAYVSSNAVLSPIRAAMDEYGVLLVPSVVSTRMVNKHENEGEKQHFVELDMVFTWVNADNPEEWIECPWYAQGLDTGEKGPGKALTYGEKTFMLKFFNIPTDADDPDQGSPHNDSVGAGRKQQPPARRQSPPKQSPPPPQASAPAPDAALPTLPADPNEPPPLAADDAGDAFPIAYLGDLRNTLMSDHGMRMQQQDEAMTAAAKDLWGETAIPEDWAALAPERLTELAAKIAELVGAGLIAEVA